jgi:hypothetical protein
MSFTTSLTWGLMIVCELSCCVSKNICDNGNEKKHGLNFFNCIFLWITMHKNHIKILIIVFEGANSQHFLLEPCS